MIFTKYTDGELERLLDSLESEIVERKQAFSGEVPRKIREAICAFANDLPNHNRAGVVIVGAKDNGEPSGIQITDDLLKALADMKTDGNIVPLPVFNVEKRVLKGHEMAVITVVPSDMPPLRYQGRIWIRTGPRRSIANEQEERILNEKRRHKNIPFDIYPVPICKISDLSRVIFENEYLPAAFAKDVLDANNRSYEERLASCKMISSVEDGLPTVLGILSIGKMPQDFIPGAYIQFLRIDGTELSDPVIDSEEIYGTIAELLRRAEDKLAAHNRIMVDITARPTHTITQQYPMAALQQILYNAVLHRTYEGTNAPVRVNWFNDRVEIASPGGPYGNVTISNFGKPGITDYRNPNIADVLKTFGYIQAFGRGIAVAGNELRKNGNPELIFEVDSNMVLCTIRNKI